MPVMRLYFGPACSEHDDALHADATGVFSEGNVELRRETFHVNLAEFLDPTPASKEDYYITMKVLASAVAQSEARRAGIPNPTRKQLRAMLDGKGIDLSMLV